MGAFHVKSYQMCVKEIKKKKHFRSAKYKRLDRKDIT